MRIDVEYDGAYPNLCSGRLVVTIDDEPGWVFPAYCLRSGGSVWFDADWMDHVSSGPWSICKWPEGFPEDEGLRDAVTEAVNDAIPHGCCGGCV